MDYKKLITSYNNTNYWELDGRGYIDSMMYPNVFAKLGFLDFTIENYVNDTVENEKFLFGCDSTGLIFGGRATNCHVYSFKL